MAALPTTPSSSHNAPLTDHLISPTIPQPKKPALKKHKSAKRPGSSETRPSSQLRRKSNMSLVITSGQSTPVAQKQAELFAFPSYSMSSQSRLSQVYDSIEGRLSNVASGISSSNSSTCSVNRKKLESYKSGTGSSLRYDYSVPTSPSDESDGEDKMEHFRDNIHSPTPRSGQQAEYTPLSRPRTRQSIDASITLVSEASRLRDREIEKGIRISTSPSLSNGSSTVSDMKRPHSIAWDGARGSSRRTKATSFGAGSRLGGANDRGRGRVSDEETLEAKIVLLGSQG